MEQTQSYDELKAWQEAMSLAAEVYRAVPVYPDYASALATATGATAVEITTSIAEGWASRYTTKEMRAHLQRARKELYRLENQLMLAMRLGYITSERMDRIWPMTQTTGSYLGALLRML